MGRTILLVTVVTLAVMMVISMFASSTLAQKFSVSDLRILDVLGRNRNYYNPNWSPDGRKIAFEAVYKKSRQLFVYDVVANRYREFVSDKKQISSSPRLGPSVESGFSYRNFGLCWLGSGDWFVYVGSGPYGYHGLYLGDLGNKDQTRISGSPIVGPDALYMDSPSPHLSGEHVVYRQAEKGNLILRVILNAFNPERRQNTALLNKPNMTAAEPSVSPDGDKILFTGVMEGDSNIYLLHVIFREISVDTGELFRLTDWPSSETRARWSPDGQHIAFLSDRSHKQQEALWVMDVDGTEKRMLCNAVVDIDYPEWHPDGRHIFFVKQSGEEKDPICYVDIETGKMETLHTGTYHNRDLSISKDGKKIALCAFRLEDPTLTWISLYVADLRGP